MHLTRPRLNLVRNTDGSYSIQDSTDDLARGPPGPPARFSFNNIEVTDGTIDFEAPAGGPQAQREGPFDRDPLSSLPYQTTIKVLPRVEGKDHGSPFALTGSTTPFARERDAALDINLDAVSLPEYMAYLPFKLRGRAHVGNPDYPRATRVHRRRRAVAAAVPLAIGSGHGR